MANKSTSQDFQFGHPKYGGKKKGHKMKTPTVWMLESLAKRGYNFEKELVGALNEAKNGDDKIRGRALDLLDRLIKLAPHIANRPKETVGLEGVENLVIKDFEEIVVPEKNGKVHTGEEK